MEEGIVKWFSNHKGFGFIGTSPTLGEVPVSSIKIAEQCLVFLSETTNNN